MKVWILSASTSVIQLQVIKSKLKTKNKDRSEKQNQLQRTLLFRKPNFIGMGYNDEYLGNATCSSSVIRAQQTSTVRLHFIFVGVLVRAVDTVAMSSTQRQQ